MTGVTGLLISIVAILLVVIIGYKFNLNMGLIAIFFAYILGAFGLGNTPAEIINLWPVSLFLMLFSVTLFYAFASSNGTLEKLAKKVVYASRKAPWSIPIVIFVLGMFMSGIGAGDSALVALVPIAITIARVTNMSYYLAVISAMSGINIGAFSPIATIGIFCRSLVEQVGQYGEPISNAIGDRMLLQSFAMFTIAFVAAYIIFKGYKITAPELEVTEPFDKKQKQTLILVALFVGIMLVIPVLATLTKAAFFIYLKGKIHLVFTAFLLSAVAVILKLADEKQAFSKVPLTAITTISGMSMLVGIIVQTGAIDIMTSFVSNNLNSGLTVQVMMGIFGGLMSLFVAGYIVNSAFFPLIPGLAAAFAMDPGSLYSAVAIGAIATAVSPFSQIGGFAVASIEDDVVRKKVFGSLLIWPFINLVVYVILMVLGL